MITRRCHGGGTVVTAGARHVAVDEAPRPGAGGFPITTVLRTAERELELILERRVVESVGNIVDGRNVGSEAAGEMQTDGMQVAHRMALLVFPAAAFGSGRRICVFDRRKQLRRRK